MDSISAAALRDLVSKVNEVMEDAKRGTTTELTALGMVAMWAVNNDIEVTER